MLILGTLKIPSLVMFGDSADFVRVAIDEWLQLRQRVSLLKQGIPQDKMQALVPFVEELTKLQGDKQMIELKSIKTEQDLLDLQVIVNRLEEIAGTMLAQNPEMTKIAFGLSPEAQLEVTSIEKIIIEKRREIIKNILECLDPVIDIKEFEKAKISSLQKELFIYEVAKEPENNMDASFLAVMERLSPQMLTLFQTY